jgi:hypothetical protein
MSTSRVIEEVWATAAGAAGDAGAAAAAVAVASASAVEENKKEIREQCEMHYR